MEQELMRLTVRRANDALKTGDAPGAESSILKVVGTELNQRRWKLAMDIGGADALGWSGAAFSERDQALCRQWLRSRGNTIEGGSSEIQRNILARTVLGMPK
jgi:alkylation response protein AidB-like acyl-CoA dehydrogenase